MEYKTESGGHMWQNLAGRDRDAQSLKLIFKVAQLLTPVILATWEAEIRRTPV
jgi:hypothetical protein